MPTVSRLIRRTSKLMDARSNPLWLRFGKNGFAQIYTQFLTLTIQFVQIPLFLSFWGKGFYAEWLVLTGLPSMLSILDFGVAQASASKATIQAAGEDWAGARVSINTSQMFTTVLGLTLVGGACVTVPFLSVHSSLGLKLIGEMDSRIIVMAMVSYLAVNLQGGVVDAFHRTIGKPAVGALLNSNRRLLDLIVTTLCLCLGGSGVTLALSLLTGQAFYMLSVAVFSRRKDPHHLLGYKNASQPEFRKILKPSLAYMGFPLSQMLTMQGGVQMLNLIGATSLIVPFTMTRTLVRTVIQIAVVITNSLKPELSRLIGSGKASEARQFTRKIALVASACALVWYLLLVAFGPKIIHFWGHGQVKVSHLLLLMVGLHAFVNVCWFVSAAYKIAGNRHTRLAVTYGSFALLGMLGWYLIRERIDPYMGVSLMMLLPELAASLSGWLGTRREQADSSA